MSDKFAFRLPGLALCVVVLLFGVAGPVNAEHYSPLFSQKMLRTLDEATRVRFAALEAENYRRWRNRNPQAPDLAAAARQHQETKAVVRRIQEGRALSAETKRRNAPGGRLNAKQKNNCATVAAEIEELSAGGSFYEKAANGEKRHLSDEEVATRVKSQQKSYNRHCKS